MERLETPVSPKCDPPLLRRFKKTERNEIRGMRHRGKLRHGSAGAKWRYRPGACRIRARGRERRWCCWRGLNSRPLPYQGSALPLSYNSQAFSARFSLAPARGAPQPLDARPACCQFPYPWKSTAKLRPSPHCPAKKGWPRHCGRICAAARRKHGPGMRRIRCPSPTALKSPANSRG